MIRIFLLIAISFNLIYAKDNSTVNYSLFLEKIVFFDTVDTKIIEGNFKVGADLVISEAALLSFPVDFSIYQNFYNVPVGCRHSIDFGSIYNKYFLKFNVIHLSKKGNYEIEF